MQFDRSLCALYFIYFNTCVSWRVDGVGVNLTYGSLMLTHLLLLLLLSCSYPQPTNLLDFAWSPPEAICNQARERVPVLIIAKDRVHAWSQVSAKQPLLQQLLASEPHSRPSLFVYMHTYIHTYIHTYTHTYTHTYRCADRQTYIHKYTHKGVQTYRHTYIYTCIHTYIQTDRQTYIYIHTRIHIYVCTYISFSTHRTYVHTPYISGIPYKVLITVQFAGGVCFRLERNTGSSSM